MKKFTDIKKIPLDDLVQSVWKSKQAMEELEASAQVLKDEIADRLRRMKIDGTKTKDGLLVQKIYKTLFSGVTLPYARELNAVREVVDSDKLRTLMKRGVKIKGAKQISFITIKEG